MAQELKLKLTVDAETGKITSVSTELDKLGKTSDKTTASVFKGVAAWDLLKKAVSLANQVFEDGIKEVNETANAMAKAQTAAAKTGIAFNDLVSAADNLVTPVSDATDQLLVLSQLTSKGIGLKDAETLVKQFGDIAAAGKNVGETVPDAIQRMVDAFISGRTSGAELQKIFPALSVEMKKLDAGASQAQKNQALLNAAMQQSGISAGALERYMQTLEGQMEVTNKTISNVKEGFVEGLMPALNQAVGSILDLGSTLLGAGTNAKTFEEKARDVGAVIGDYLVRAINLAKTGILGFMALLNLLKLAFFESKKAALDMAKGIIDAVNSTLKKMQSLAAIAPDLLNKKQIDAAVSAMTGFSDGLDKMAADTQTSIDKTENTLTNFSEGATKALEDALGGVSTSAQSIVQPMAKVGKVIEDTTGQSEALTKALKDLALQSHLMFLKEFEKQAQENAESLKKGNAAIVEAAITQKALNAEWKAGPPILEDLQTQTAAEAEALIDMTIRMREAREEIDNILSRASGLSDFFHSISIMGGMMGKAFDVAGDAAGAFGSVFEEILELGGTKTQAWAGGIAAAVNVVGEAVGGMAEKILNAGAAIAMGFATGGWVGAVVAGLGVVTNALFSFFKKDWTKEARKMAHDIGFAISDELAKAIGELGKTTAGGTDTAIQLMLRDIIDEIGITESTIGGFLQRARDLFSFLERGQLSVVEVSGILNSVFSDLAAGAEEFGAAYQAQLIEIIELSKRFGVEVQAITDYVNAQFDSVADAINGLAGKLSDLVGRFDLEKGILPSEGQLNLIAHRFNEVANAVVEAFNAMSAEGIPLDDIFAKLGPSLDALQAAAEKFGLKGSEAFQQLLKEFEKLQKLAPKIERLEFFTNLNKGLANVGKLSVESFHKLENVAKSTYKALIAGGLTSEQAIRQMLPTLTEIIREHELLGTPIDKNTQALIDQAQALGLLGGETATDKLIGAFTTLGEKMDTFVNALAKALGITLDIAEAADTITLPTGEILGRTRHDTVSHATQRGVFVVPRDNYLANLHSGEGIVGRDSMQTITQATPSNNGPMVQITINGPILGADVGRVIMKEMNNHKAEIRSMLRGAT